MSNAAFFICVQSGVVPLAIGEPGTSKTASCRAFSSVVNRHFEHLVGGEREPGDCIGFPALTKDERGRQFLEFVPATWRVRCEEAQNGGFVLLDELTNATPAVQAAFLRVLGEGIPNTWLAAAANPVEQAATGFDLTPPTVNRLCVLNWETPINSWIEGLQLGFDKIKHQFPIVPRDFEAGLPHTNVLITSFLKSRPELAQRYPKTRADAGKPWPSLRSWTNASRVQCAALAVGAGSDITSTLISGCVGEGATIEYLTWAEKLDLPDPEDLLKDPQQYKPSQRGDLSFAVLSAVVSAVVRQNTPERWNAAWEVLDRQVDVAADIAAACANPLVKHKPDPALTPPANIRKRLYPIIQAATADIK